MVVRLADDLRAPALFVERLAVLVALLAPFALGERLVDFRVEDFFLVVAISVAPHQVSWVPRINLAFFSSQVPDEEKALCVIAPAA